MIKYLFILINSLGLFIYGLFSGDNGITVTGKIPSSMVAGQETSIEITIQKGSMNGFAKLQLDLPEGFSVKSADELGATYTFNEGIAKWVWATLPQESEMVLKLTVVPSESSVGLKTISAKYSYVENNLKQVTEMTPAEVTVLASGSEPLASEQLKPDSTKIAIAVDTAASKLNVAVTSNNETPGQVTATRKIEQGSAPDEKLITLNIKKGSTRGFARYSDDLPEGVIVKGAETDGASFSVSDGKIKFVWVNVPEKDELVVSYSMSSATSQKVKLDGEYSYLEDNQSKKFKFDAEEINFEVAVAKQEEIQKQPEPENKQPESTVEPVKEEPVKTTAVLEKKEADMIFLVQIGAFSKKKVTAKKLEKKFKIKESIRSEMQGGFTKFMVGSHEEYKEARDHRETIKTTNVVKSAFVVAYNQGKRITVQEALMITNQKWFR